MLENVEIVQVQLGTNDIAGCGAVKRTSMQNFYKDWHCTYLGMSNFG
jgi:hypothetical protein